MIFKKNKLHNNEFTPMSETIAPAELHNKKFILLHFATCYGFWLITVLALYWQVLPAMPYRDQPDLMRNHQLAQTDWQWFLSMLSYNRTRILLPGDYFAFRPLHMVVIALQDIFLRYHMVAQGVVNCMQFAFAATIFSSLTKRYIDTFAAIALTLLWVSQLAGSSIVFWQHITPYILCPAFLLLALLILDDDSLPPFRLKMAFAAVSVFLATLTHEVGVATALSVSMLAILFGRRDVARQRQLLLVFGLPAISYFIINLADYFIIHPPPSLLAPADTVSNQLSIILMTKFIGSIGAALFASPMIHLNQLSDGFSLWEFYNESPPQLISMAVVVVALLVTSSVVAACEMRKNGISQRVLFLTLLFSFFLAIFGVCGFRMYSRGIYYMAMASYYYALFALILCGIIACLLPTANKSIIKIIAIITLILCVFNVFALRIYFSKGEKQRKNFQSVVTEGRKILLGTPGSCYAGAMPLSFANGSMFYDVSCANRPGAKPLYVHSNNGEVWLSSVEYNSNNSPLVPTPIPLSQKLPANEGWVTSIEIPYGHDVQFTVNRAEKFTVAFALDGKQQSFTVLRNVLIRSYQEKAWSNPIIDNATMDKDSAASLITYKLGFTNDRIMLFADGIYIADLPALPPKNTYVDIVLRSPGNKPADFGNMYITEHPSLGFMHVTPRYLLTRQ